ncbi:321_t:CDS:2 [Funneliformis caledonium]|uniref:321_t:CDS:1 n=1 Tax=Funneliformis caledonium TaxID=1117310 RepID=A0A9N8ZWT6_9GLOM|nr:321_t:CDS:2 [Funneliformis caledonium]
MTIYKFIRLEDRAAKWAVSKYKSHCCLPKNIERIMDQLDNKNNNT